MGFHPPPPPPPSILLCTDSVSQLLHHTDSNKRHPPQRPTPNAQRPASAEPCASGCCRCWRQPPGRLRRCRRCRRCRRRQSRRSDLLVIGGEAEKWNHALQKKGHTLSYPIYYIYIYIYGVLFWESQTLHCYKPDSLSFPSCRTTRKVSCTASKLHLQVNSSIFCPDLSCWSQDRGTSNQLGFFLVSP